MWHCSGNNFFLQCCIFFNFSWLKITELFRSPAPGAAAGAGRIAEYYVKTEIPRFEISSGNIGYIIFVFFYKCLFKALMKEMYSASPDIRNGKVNFPS